MGNRQRARGAIAIAGLVWLLASLAPAASQGQTCTDTFGVNGCVPGGGSKTTDCFFEWLVVPPPSFDSNGIPVNNLICYEGDPSCDIDPDLQNRSCTIRTSLCLNNVDPRLTTCSPTDLASLEVKRPRARSRVATDLQNLAELEAQAGPDGLGLTIARGRTPIFAGTTTAEPNLCSPPVPIIVPLRVSAAGTVGRGRTTLKVKVRSLAGSSDTDALELECRPSTCGNGLIEQLTEQCDDRNRINGDGCDQNCQHEIPTATPTWTETPTTTPSVTRTPTRTKTPTETLTPEPTDTPTETPTLSPTDTATPTLTSSRTATRTPTATTVPSSTATMTPTATLTPTDTPTQTPTRTSTHTRTRTRTKTPTPTHTETPTEIPTSTPTDTPSETPTASATAIYTDVPTDTPTSTPSRTATPIWTATATPTSTATPSATRTPTITATLPPIHLDVASFTPRIPPPCLILVHGKRTDTGTYTDWNNARSYWIDGSNDFIKAATRNFTTPYYVVGYNGTQAYWDTQSAGELATEIVNATNGGDDGGGNHCALTYAQGGTFWLVGHSMAGSVIDYVLGNADPTDPNYNRNGPYDVATQRVALAVTIAGTHRGSQGADFVCGGGNPFCSFFAQFLQSCDDATFWIRSSDDVQVRAFASPPAKTVWLASGFAAIIGASSCLGGEDDGVVQHASTYACDGSATAGYDNTNICDRNHKQEISGFRNLDTSHENHDQSRNDSDRDNRDAIPDGVWVCNGSPCTPGTTVQTSMSSGQFVGALY